MVETTHRVILGKYKQQTSSSSGSSIIMASGRRCDLMRIAFLFKLVMIAILFSLCEGLCGNGILEDQEECDCGAVMDCKDPCCRALVCTLKEGAQCSNLDPCCKNCKFKKKWDLCRYSKNECDLSEFCTGESSSCPPNIFHRDGKKCSQEQGYCSKGYCQTHENQCQIIYKTHLVTSATPECYMTLNRLGTESGNCGNLKPCSLDDTLCGTLQCSTTDGTPPGSVGAGGVMSAQGESNSVDQQPVTSCPTFGPMVPLVQDMTKCGPDRICLHQRCVNISSVFNIRVKCPSSIPDAECSGHGDCTNRLNCQCHEGWGGKDCSHTEEIVEVKETASTRATPRIHDIPVTRTEPQGVITHKMPDEEDDTNYTLGMIFAIAVVSVSIICFMCALIYCYFFSSPITKAKESLDSHGDDYSIEDNSLQYFQSLSHAPTKTSDTCSAQICQEVIPSVVGTPEKTKSSVITTPTTTTKTENHIIETVNRTDTTNLHTGYDKIEIHENSKNGKMLESSPPLKVQLDIENLKAATVTVPASVTTTTTTVPLDKS